MKNLPIKKGIEKHLEPAKYNPGVWQVKNKKMYIKLTSKLNHPVVRIKPATYDNHKDALEDTIACAKVYKKFIKEGLYPPDTQLMVCKDDKDNLTLMITIPELKINKIRISSKAIYTKLQDIIERMGLDYQKYLFADLKPTCKFNWGYDKKTCNLYAHDLHLAYKTSEILDMAKELGYKK